MKTLIIYDSAFGNTKQIADEIGKELKAKIISVKDFQKSDLDNLDLLIVGSPINGWRPLPTIIEFLNSFKPNDLKNIQATTFDTRVKLFIHGDAKNKIAKFLENAGATIITQPEAFYVIGSKGPLFEGELDRASKWGQVIITKLKE